MDAELEAARMKERVNRLAAEQMQADMRAFMFRNTGATLSDWASQSDWAHGTGGEADESGAPLRVLSGEWKRLWEEVQLSEQMPLEVLRHAADMAHSAQASASNAQDDLAAERQKVASLQSKCSRLQARLHSVLEVRKEEKQREEALVDDLRRQLDVRAHLRYFQRAWGPAQIETGARCRRLLKQTPNCVLK